MVLTEEEVKIIIEKEEKRKEQHRIRNLRYYHNTVKNDPEKYEKYLVRCRNVYYRKVNREISE